MTAEQVTVLRSGLDRLSEAIEALPRRLAEAYKEAHEEDPDICEYCGGSGFIPNMSQCRGPSIVSGMSEERAARHCEYGEPF